MSKNLVKCRDSRADCFARDSRGYCKCLCDTCFPNNVCAFYKTRSQVINEDPYYFGYTRKGVKTC